MEKTHWKTLTNPNYLGGYSLPEGQDIIVTIDYVQREQVTGNGGRKEFEVVAHLKDGLKPFILNKTNMKQIQKIYKTPYLEDWKGRAVQIYFDPNVKFAGEKVGGLRIRDFVPQQTKASLICSDCGKEITSASGKSAEWISKYTHQQYGKELCSECALILKNKLDANKAPDPFKKSEE